MSGAYWSYLLTAVGVLGLYLAGRKVWWAWYVGFVAQGLWVAYALASKQYGFLLSAAVYGWVYLKNGLSWQRDHASRTMRLDIRFDQAIGVIEHTPEGFKDWEKYSATSLAVGEHYRNELRADARRRWERSA